MTSIEVMEPETASPMLEDGAFFEIVNDQRVELPPMGVPENFIAFDLAAAIREFSRPLQLGRAITETLFRLRAQPNLQRRPDAAFVSYERWPKGRGIEKGNAWDVIPDLIVEVVSPTNLAEEIVTKVREYFEAGVRRAWIIYVHESLVYEYDSPRSIRVLGRKDVLEGGEVIPGFRIALSELFEGIEDTGPA